MKKYIAIAILLPIMAFLGAMYFYNKNINILDFNIEKDDIKAVIINTNSGSYKVSDIEQVLEITNEASKLKKLAKLQDSSTENMDHPEVYTGILIQTIDDKTYGGQFWKNDSRVIMDGNGYLWLVSESLLQWLDKAMNGAEKISPLLN